jgi:methionyl-tRNA formyltransferase/peptidoglycan/xylan/chitin deacetylase (PgdA/CDA1 family)
MSRIVVLTGTLSYSVRKGIADLCAHIPGAEVLVVVHRPKKRPLQLLRSQWRNLRRNGWRWIPYQLGDLVDRIHARFKRNGAEDAGPGAAYSLETIVRSARLLYTDDIHGEAAVAQIHAFAPDLGVSLAAPILKPAVFAIPRLGTVNLHKGKVPEYRGMPPAFWELWRGEKEVGCTVHKVEAGLDTGAVILEASIPVRPHSTLRGLQYTLDELGVRLMTRAVKAVLDGSAVATPQRPGGQTFRKPTLAQQEALLKRHGPRSDASARNLAKNTLFRGYAGFAAPLPRRLRGWRGNQRIVVLLYHRVNDEMRDQLTIGIEQFDQQMALLARRCRLVDIRDVVAGRVTRDTTRPIVAVTFDDGYRDNYEHAFPVLLRNRVPAAFFVSTGKIGVDVAFDHDLRRIGHGLPTMTWEHLREMHAAGYTIGSHSVSHLDCGKASLDQVRAELRESRERLSGELGLDQLIFAYPYGGRQNMTPSALELVRAEGYAGCLSAYGGRNDGPIDPFNVRRIGISHNFSEWSFRARLEGWG